MVGVVSLNKKAFVTVVVLLADAGDEVLLRGDGRTWGESGYHSGGTYYPDFLDGGGEW